MPRQHDDLVRHLNTITHIPQQPDHPTRHLRLPGLFGHVLRRQRHGHHPRRGRDRIRLRRHELRVAAGRHGLLHLLLPERDDGGHGRLEVRLAVPGGGLGGLWAHLCVVRGEAGQGERKMRGYRVGAQFLMNGKSFKVGVRTADDASHEATREQ